MRIAMQQSLLGLKRWSLLPVWALACLWGLSTLVGCQTIEEWRDPGQVSQATQAYDQGDYAQAYRIGASVAQRGEVSQRDLAAYIAGLSARQLGDTSNATSYLKQASRSFDRDLAADASATLGTLLAEQGNFSDAARYLLRAAELYRGEDRARAYFHAAIAQQKLGRWPQARTNLILARGSSSDPAFWQQVSQQLNVTGYTIQTGAFRSADNAQNAAQDAAQRASVIGLAGPRMVSATNERGLSVTLVQVGEFATFSSAVRYRNEIGLTNAVIVPLASSR